MTVWTSRNRELSMCYLNVLYMEKKEEGRRGTVRDLKDGMEEYEIIKGYHVRREKNRKINHDISESNVEQ